jgi:hypothetical protein
VDSHNPLNQIELLNVESHRDLMITRDVADHPNFVNVFLNEFTAASACCPIFFAKDANTGEFYTGALFGFRQGELLVDGADKGKAAFRPLDLVRQGFFASDENIAFDPSSPRFGPGATIRVFDEDGQPTNALRNIQRAIGEVIGGRAATKAFIQEMLSLNVVEPIDVSLAFDDGETLTLVGLYTVSREALMDLDDATVLRLYRNWYIQAAWCVAFSQNQVAVLAQRRNERLATGF